MFPAHCHVFPAYCHVFPAHCASDHVTCVLNCSILPLFLKVQSLSESAEEQQWRRGSILLLTWCYCAVSITCWQWWHSASIICRHPKPPDRVILWVPVVWVMSGCYGLQFVLLRHIYVYEQGARFDVKARPHLYMDSWKRPTPVLERLSLTHDDLGWSFIAI